MKLHLAHLAAVTDITPILAVRALWTWEGDFSSSDHEPALTVAEIDDKGSTLQSKGLYVAGADEPCLVARHTGDNISLLSSGAVPACVAEVLAAIGLGRKAVQHGGDTLLYGGDAETLWDRVLCIDTALILMRKLLRLGTDSMNAAAAGARIIEFAQQWHNLRCRIINQGESPSLAASREEMLKEAAQAPQKWGIAGLTSIRLLDDPRGSALAIRCEDSSYDLELPPIAMTWPVGVVRTASTASPPKRERYAVIPTTVPDSVLGVLQSVVIADKTVRITAKLPKKLYDQVNELLKAMGGRWHTGKQVHVFDDDPACEVRAVCESGVIALPRDYEFFRTPAALVAKVIQRAGLQPGMRVLEPNGGDGALAMAAAEIVGRDLVTCYELMPHNVNKLRTMGFRIEGPSDFLQVVPQPEFQCVVMNPPFSGMRDVAHISHALKFVKPGGRLVAIASTHWQNVETKPAQAFKAMLAGLGANVESVPPGAFKESGTDVPTTLITLDVPATFQEAHTEAPAPEQALLF